MDVNPIFFKISVNINVRWVGVDRGVGGDLNINKDE